MQSSSNGVPLDLGQLQVIMKTIELACSSIQIHANPAAAEATILSLCQSTRPYQACQFILENSHMANARFQAATAIRYAAIREWSFLATEDKKNLIRFCLCFVMQNASAPEGYVQSKVSSVASQLLKRGWLDFVASERDEFLYEVKQAILGVHGVDVQFIGVTFLESLISEFSSSTSSAMGLPREFHEQCRRSLELEYLKAFYSLAQDAAQSVTTRIVESNSAVPEVKVCTASLRLMLQILNWDFQYSPSAGSKPSVNHFSIEDKHGSDSPKRFECILVQPGPAWHDVLVSSDHIKWLLNLYWALRQKFSCEGYWLDCPIAVSARKLIVQFCSLTGTIFPSDNRQIEEHHLVQMLSGIIHWISPPDTVSKAIECGKSESEMLDGCRALLSIATVTTPYVFDQLLKSISPFGTIHILSALMCEAVKSFMVNNTEEETWCWVARDILLDTWTALLMPSDNIGGNALLPPEGVDAAAGLFALIVEADLKAASPSNDDEDTFLQASISCMNERLSSYALIGRAAIDITIPLLTKLFSERFTRLKQGRGITYPIETLEELYSLLLITGHVLADEGEGETPLVPKAIQAHFVDTLEMNQHPVIVLFSSILGFAEQCLNPDIRALVFSPRLMEAVVWFLARWSDTYLMPPLENCDSKCTSRLDEHQHPSQCFTKVLLSFCGEHNHGKLVLDIIVRICMVALTSYPGEKDLQDLTCFHLLNALVRRKNVCSYLVGLDSWRDIGNAFANDRTMISLNASHQRYLARSLVLSATGMNNAEASNQYVRDLMGGTTAYLIDISNQNELKNISQQPDVILSVSCLFERLRGASIAVEPRTQKAVYEIGFSVMNSVLIFLEVYKHEFAVVNPLLKFVVDWVDGQIVYLEALETAVVVNFCMCLLQLYSSHNIGKISVSFSSNLLNEANTEKYKDLRALLQLLSNLCSKDMVDFSSNSSEEQGINISQVVFFGLHIVSPLISLEMLKYPKLCRDYFTLLSHMLEIYPETIAQLNIEAFGHVIKTLDFALHHQDVEIVSKCLGSLNGLSSFHFKDTAAGRPGLGFYAVSYKDSNGNLQQGILSRFLQSLLQLLLFEDYSTDLVSSAADALLPLIFCEQGLYQRLSNELIERQIDPRQKSRLTNALQSLTSSNQLNSTLDRTNYQRFRKNLNSFLVDVGGFLRMV